MCACPTGSSLLPNTLKAVWSSYGTVHGDVHEDGIFALTTLTDVRVYMQPSFDEFSCEI
jgi:hypothetical protein